MPGKKINPGSYRYGFNGKENDPETGTQDYGLRIYDGRIAKFLSVDPLTGKFPMLTPYQFAGNIPIKFIDLDGAEPTSNQEDAQCLLEEKTADLKQSDKFPNVKPDEFIKNMNERINNPDGLCQGFHSNFCGPSALMSQTFAKNDPVGYVNFMISLYTTGTATYNNGINEVIFSPSPSVMKAAGTLKNGPNPDVPGSQSLANNPADQMLLLTVKDKYNLLGIIRGSFKEGRQNHVWASTPFIMELNMAKKFLGYNYQATGSTVGGANLDISVINSEANCGNTVYLFVNGPIFRNETHAKIRDIVGTHFIRVHQIKVQGDQVIIDMWDYGVRREKKMSLEQYQNSVYGTIILESPK